MNKDLRRFSKSISSMSINPYIFSKIHKISLRIFKLLLILFHIQQLLNCISFSFKSLLRRILTNLLKFIQLNRAIQKPCLNFIHYLMLLQSQYVINKYNLIIINSKSFCVVLCLLLVLILHVNQIAYIIQTYNRIKQQVMASFGLNIRIPRQSLIKLSNHENKNLIIKFTGGRQVQGLLKSWDKQMNLILDNCQEIMGVDETQKQQIKRTLGLIIVKGSQIQSICLKDGYKLIDNPYENLVQGQQEQGENEDEEEQEQEQEQDEKYDQNQKQKDQKSKKQNSKEKDSKQSKQSKLK